MATYWSVARYGPSGEQLSVIIAKGEVHSMNRTLADHNAIEIAALAAQQLKLDPEVAVRVWRGGGSVKSRIIKRAYPLPDGPRWRKRMQSDGKPK
jgi:hypothetical protein